MVRWTDAELRDFERRYKKDLEDSMKQENADPTHQGIPLYKVLAQQKPDDMNKLEKAWYEHLIRTTDYIILPQSVKLRLADRTWYTPDFFCMASDGIVRIYETKGFMRDDAAVKIKVAAEQYSFWRFFLVTKKKGGVWDVRSIPNRTDA